ncbi:MAG TPA: lysylphosphatidylglycerol synthase transmembrane domain-containing protein [Candidatus Saccharimonadales bacterium]
MAENNSFWRRRWKLVLNIATLVALVLLVFAIREDLADTIENLAKVNAWLLLLLLPIQAVNYHAQTKFYQHMFRIVGNKLSYGFLYKAALELNFVNHVFPSGGAAGISYFALRLKNNEITAAKATLIQVMKLALTFLAFELLLVVGMIALSAMGRVNNLTILVGAVLSTLLLVGTFGFMYIIESKARINSFFTGVTKVVNRLIQWVRPSRHAETINVAKAREAFGDFHDNYKQLRNSLPQLKAPFWWAVMMNLTEILSIYVVFMAFSEFVNIGAVILAYGVANFAGLISVLPGGVGVYEFLMTAILATAGVSAAVSLPVIIMYRVLNTVIQVPPGYYFYQKNLSSSQKQQVRGV